MLSNEDVYKSRDVSTAEMVAEMVALNYFDEQITYYGCAYIKKGRIEYRINENVNKIYEFWKNSEKRGCYTTNVLRHIEFVKIPSGKKEEKTRVVQKNFVDRMKEIYPKELFLVLSTLGSVRADDRATNIFYKWKDELELCYDEDQIRLVEGVLQYAFKAKLLTIETTNVIKVWIEERLEIISNCENTIWQDERWFFGFLFIDNGVIKPYVNAEECIVLERQFNKMAQGIRCTPIFKKKYWVDSNKNKPLREWRNLFEYEMTSLMDSRYMNILEKIWSFPSVISSVEFEKMSEKIDFEKYPASKSVINFYKVMWQV